MEFIVLIIIVTVGIIFFVYESNQYEDEAYYRVTKNPYSHVMRDKGKYGEYLTYKALRHFENNGSSFLFNIIIPKKNGGTTEIDLLLISPKGLFVFECKNYSGWIFGNEAQKNWTQTLPKGRRNCHKEYFYNPIMQNASHIKHLKNLIGQNVPMRSIIVFSNACVLKDITVKSNDISVINCCEVAAIVAQISNQIQTDAYTEREVSEIYNKLFPYTQRSQP